MAAFLGGISATLVYAIPRWFMFKYAPGDNPYSLSFALFAATFLGVLLSVPYNVWGLPMGYLMIFGQCISERLLGFLRKKIKASR
jgi:hypothetical protein